MAQPAVQKSQVPALLQAAVSDDDGETRVETIAKALHDELVDEFLKNYIPKSFSTQTTDTLDNRYKVNVQNPLPQFNMRSAIAYAVTDETQPERNLYALVCAQYLPARQKLAQSLKTITNANIVAVVAEGIVTLSHLNEERYVIIHEQPKGRPLSELIASQTQQFSDRFIIDKVIAPLCLALNVFEELGQIHGNINPNNIYIGADLILGACAAEPCGYSQDFHYEPAWRIQSSVAGKGLGHPSVDYYAVGVLVAHMKLRPRPLQDPDSQRFVRRLLKEGAYIGIAGYADMSDEISDLLRGTLNDSNNERWTNKQLRQWCQGKRFNLLTPTIASIGNRPFEFNDEGYQNLRELSNAIHRNWSLSLNLFREGSLARWIELATRRRDTSEYLNRLVKTYANRVGKAADEMITRCLFAFDVAAPIRMRDIATHVDGIGPLYAELYHAKDDAGLNQLNDIIEQSIPSSWAESQRRNFNNDNISPDLTQVIWVMDRSRTFVRSSILGYGPERLLYELNPTLPCQSPMIMKYHAINMKQLLIALDRIASDRNRPTVPMDRHIAAFICCKLNITREINFNEFKNYPELSKHKGLLALKFLQQAQVNAQNPKLLGLSAWVTASFMDAIGTFHSATVRKEMCAMLQPMAYAGQLTPILEYLTAYDYAGVDSDGFIAAKEQYERHTIVIQELKDEKLRVYKAYLLGSNTAKYISYTILVGLLIYLFYKD